MNEDRYAYGYEVPLNVLTQSVPVITDILNGKHYYSLREVVNLLNEQQSIIRKDEISIETMMSNMEKLEKENEQLRQFINKGRRLSVKELMDNMNENKLLRKENEQLKQEHKIAIDEMITDYKNLEKENKELQTELDSFRPVLFHDMRIGTITLYSKGGIDE